MREWHLITCEYPPQIGGVSDFTFAIARGLSAAGDAVHVWRPTDRLDAPAVAGIEVHSDLGRVSPADLQRVGRAIDAHPGKHCLLVQWVPHGYGWKSLNVPFATWLALRAWRNGDEIDLVVHEPYNNLSVRPARLFAALVHRAMLVVAVAAARRVWVSMPGWERTIRPYMLWKRPIAWLPVPAPIAVVNDMAAVTRLRRELAPNSEPLVGHFSTHSPLVTALLAPALQRVLETTTARAVLVGRDSTAFRREFLATRPAFEDRVVATGVISAESVSLHLQACSVMLQPYPDGVSSRRTTIVATLAHGLAVVTNAGPLTDDLWRGTSAVQLVDAPDPQMLGMATTALLSDDARRHKQAYSARQLHDQVFDVCHALFALTGRDARSGLVRQRALVH